MCCRTASRLNDRNTPDTNEATLEFPAATMSEFLTFFEKPPRTQRLFLLLNGLSTDFSVLQPFKNLYSTE